MEQSIGTCVSQREGEFDLGITIAIVVALAFLILFLKKQIKKYGKKKEINQAAADQIRDENLNHVILNNYRQKKGDKVAHKPYDVDYGSGADASDVVLDDGKGVCQLMVQLVERTELSMRKFVLNPAHGIQIGSNLNDNDIVVFSGEIAAHQCEIFSAGGKVYVRNLENNNKTIVRRRKERVIVNERGIRLLTGDCILLGNVSYDITISEERKKLRRMRS